MIAIASFHPDSVNKKEIKTTYAVSKSIIDQFKRNIELKNKEVEHIINQIGEESLFIIWGAAAKGITFLNCLKKDVQQRIPFVIDMNEAKETVPGPKGEILRALRVGESRINTVFGILRSFFLDRTAFHKVDKKKPALIRERKGLFAPFVDADMREAMSGRKRHLF